MYVETLKPAKKLSIYNLSYKWNQIKAKYPWFQWANQKKNLSVYENYKLKRRLSIYELRKKTTIESWESMNSMS